MYGLNLAGKLSPLLLQVIVIRLQDVDISVGGRAQALLDEINSVLGLLRLLIEADQDLGELVHHS